MVKVALPGIPLWNDQEIELYHGTLDVHVASILQQVDLSVCRSLTDFGRGFYTTTSFPQAQQWAQNLALQGQAGGPAVVRFAVERNDLAQLDCLVFVRGTPHTVDYWSFVQYCRTIPGDHNRAHTGWYDLVAGPVTGSWKKQTIVRDGDQFSFHTDIATTVLDSSQKVRVL